MREHLLAIVDAAIAGASASRAVTRALSDPQHRGILERPLHLIAAGKAAGSMAAALVAHAPPRLQTALAVGTHRPDDLPGIVEWRETAHPLPDARSVAAGERARTIARAVGSDEHLLLLLSGGASALLALPAEGISLDDKRRTVEGMMHAGADIEALNTVRKHLSGIKGGQLAALCSGSTLTLAVSDVIGDDLSVIGSGPGVADASTWAAAAVALKRWGGASHPAAVRARIARGVEGYLPDTPKPGASELCNASAQVIATRRDALIEARRVALALGYEAVVLEESIDGEARTAAERWFAATERTRTTRSPVCVISGGETTVRVVGSGHGGRNQEFALALAALLAREPRPLVAASIGTDGIDGPTDAAGALVDGTTVSRAVACGLASPTTYLDDNNSYAYFSTLGDLISTGRTDTNVGDIQILLAG
jgi:glycerate 2-kinase